MWHANQFGGLAGSETSSPVHRFFFLFFLRVLVCMAHTDTHQCALHCETNALAATAAAVASKLVRMINCTSFEYLIKDTHCAKGALRCISRCVPFAASANFNFLLRIHAGARYESACGACVANGGEAATQLTHTHTYIYAYAHAPRHSATAAFASADGASAHSDIARLHSIRCRPLAQRTHDITLHACECMPGYVLEF